MAEIALFKHWWLLLLRGIIAILFGIVAFTQPGITLSMLILLFGAFALIEGALATISAVQARKADRDWWVLLIEGLLGIAIGVIAFVNPLITTLVLLLYIAAWAIVVGALRIVEAIRLRHRIRGEFWMILGGLASIAFGILMLARPGAGALAMLLVIAIWAVVVGLTLVFVSFRVRGLGKRLEAEPRGPEVEAPAH